MTNEFPVVSEFGPGRPTCDGRANGCVVATTAAILKRYRPGEPLPPLTALGATMGQRHRQRFPESRHGICPDAWCTYCSYLELKARYVGVGYGRLSVGAIQALAAARHAVHLAGWYQEIRLVSPMSYSDSTPAGGRSDESSDGEFLHSIVIWRVGRVDRDGRPASYILSDPDVGSARRPQIPPYSEFDAREVEAFYLRGGVAATYCLAEPPPLDATGHAIVVSVAGVAYTFGGEARGRGTYVATSADGARQRRSPYVRPDNIIRTVPSGSRFQVAQTTLAGTNVGGSPVWHGDTTGTVWMHHSVLRRG